MLRSELDPMIHAWLLPETAICLIRTLITSKLTKCLVNLTHLLAPLHCVASCDVRTWISYSIHYNRERGNWTQGCHFGDAHKNIMQRIRLLIINQLNKRLYLYWSKYTREMAEYFYLKSRSLIVNKTDYWNI